MAKKTIAPMSFTPKGGWTDKTAFPTYYSSEEQVRATFQTLFDQIKDYINGAFIPGLQSAAPNESGAGAIGMEPLYESDESGDSVADKLLSLRESIADVTALNIPDGGVTSLKLDGSAVTTPKIADGAVTYEKLSDGVSSKLDSLNDARYTLMGTLIDMEKNGLSPSGRTKGLCYDSFSSSKKADADETSASITGGALITKQDAYTKVHTDAGSTTQGSSLNIDYLTMVITAPEGTSLRGVRFSCRGYADNMVYILPSLKLIVTGADSQSNIPDTVILAESAVTNTSNAGSDITLTLPSPLELTEGQKYAVTIQIFTSGYSYITYSKASLNGGMVAACLRGSTSGGTTTWVNDGLMTNLRLYIRYSQPHIYQSREQKLYGDAKRASLYINKTPGMGAVPKIALYSAGGNEEFFDMTKDETYLPFEFEGNSIEEKWDYTSPVPGSLSKVRLSLSDEFEAGQKVYSYGILFE